MNTRRANVWTLLASQFGPLLALLLVFFFFALADAAPARRRAVFVAAEFANHAHLLGPGGRGAPWE